MHNNENDYIVRALAFLEEISNDVVYQKQSEQVGTLILSERTNEFLDLYKEFYENDHLINFSSLCTPIIKEFDLDAIRFNDEKINNISYNLSDILYQCRSKLQDEDEKFNKFANEQVEGFRRVSIYITRSTIDKMKREIINTKNAIEQAHAEASTKANEDITKANEDITKANENIKSVLEKVKDVERNVMNLLPQAITVIGIFIAILTIFFGGLNLVNSFQVLANQDIHRFIIVLLFTGQIILNFLFLLMYITSRIANKSISVRCSKHVHISNLGQSQQIGSSMELITSRATKHSLCRDCIFNNVKRVPNIPEEYLDGKDKFGMQCGHINKLINSYPYVFFSNAVFFILEIAILLWWFMESYVLHNYVIEIRNLFLANTVFLALPFIVFFYILFILYSLGKPAKWKKDNRVKFIIIGIAIILLGIVLFGFGVSIVYIS